MWVILLGAMCLLAGVPGLAPQPRAQDSGVATIRVGVQRGTGYEIVTLPLETYIGRVLAGEALPGSQPAALEALAIAIRTYSAFNSGRHRADGFDLCDQTHCQVMRTATPATDRAALATAGKILLYNGVPASVFYSASCGGHTEKPSNVWPGADDPPYLPSRSDDGCGGVPEWATELTLSDLRRAFAAAGFRGTLRSVRVAGRNESGRVARLALDGLIPAEVSGQDLRFAVGRTLGWQRVQSTAFELRRTTSGYRFQGHGAGHGVGMCVIGSSRLAVAGVSADDILKRYFPGAVIGTYGAAPPRITGVPPVEPAEPELPREPPRPMIAPPPAPVLPAPARAPVGPAPDPAKVGAGGGAPLLAAANAAAEVILPETDQGERREIAVLVQRHRDDLARALQLTPPARIVTRFHATAGDYERASGRPWFTLGTTVNQEVHLLPIDALRARGLLDRAVRHQLVHVMTDAALAGRPLWVREGAAAYFAESGRPGTLRGACPTDAELLQPVSAGALGDAYTRARGCFERQLAAGRSWKQVR